MNPRILEYILKLKDEASKELQKIGDNYEETGKRGSSAMEKLKVVTLAAGAAIGAGLIASAKAAIEFESAFAGVRKTVDASEAEFGALSKNIRNIAKEAPVSTTELARIMELAGQLGVRGVDNLTKFTDTISKIAVTTNLTTESAAMDFARIANIMQEPIENVDKMASSVVDLGNNFATTEAEIVNFANRIAGAGKIAGITTAEVFGISTALSSVGVEAERGGTAVQKVLLAMTQAASGATAKTIDNTKAIAKNTDKLKDLTQKLEVAKKRQSEFGDKTKESTKMMAQSTIDKYTSQISNLQGEIGALNATQGQAAISAGRFADILGVTDSQFKKMFAENPAKVFEQFVLKLGSAGDEAISIFDDLDLADQRLISSFLSVSNAGDLITRSISTASQAFNENTALATEAEKRYATTASQLQIMWNRLNDIAIVIGSVLLPPLNEFLNVVSGGLSVISGMAEQLIGWIQQNGFLREEFGKLSTLYNESVKPAIENFNTNLRDNLIPKIQELWNEIQNNVRPNLEAMTSKIREELTPEIESLTKHVGEGLIPALRGWSERMILAIGESETLTLLTQNFGNIVEAVGRVIKTAYGLAFDFIIGKIKEKIKFMDLAVQGITNFVNAVTGIYDKIKEPLEKVKNAIDRALNPFHHESPSLVDNVMEGLGKIRKQYDAISNLELPSIKSELSPALAGFPSSGSPTSQVNNNSPITVNAPIYNDTDPYKLAQILGFELSNRSRAT